MTRRVAMHRPARRSDGFSLVENVVALGLLAAVLIAISGLFVLANRQLDGGRNHSVAISVARDILEETESRAFRQVWTIFGFDGAAGAYTVDSRINSAAAEWQAALDAELQDARAEIRIESVTEGGPGPALRDAQAVRVQVTIFWTEGLRARSVRLTTVRV